MNLFMDFLIQKLSAELRSKCQIMCSANDFESNDDKNDTKKIFWKMPGVTKISRFSGNGDTFFLSIRSVHQLIWWYFLWSVCVYICLYHRVDNARFGKKLSKHDRNKHTKLNVTD